MKSYNFKVANMKKEQYFTLYPYDGGDEILLQSDKRFARFNLRTGEGMINGSNVNYANSIRLAMDPVKCKLPDHILIEIQGFLYRNEGKEGNINGCLFFENKELFSRK